MEEGEGGNIRMSLQDDGIAYLGKIDMSRSENSRGEPTN